jgi:hypothetical protein
VNEDKHAPAFAVLDNSTNQIKFDQRTGMLAIFDEIEQAELAAQRTPNTYVKACYISATPPTPMEEGK